MRQWSPAYGTEHSHYHLDRKEASNPFLKKKWLLTSSITNLALWYDGSSDRYGSTHGMQDMICMHTLPFSTDSLMNRGFFKKINLFLNNISKLN
jgi:hypothetical protein